MIKIDELVELIDNCDLRGEELKEYLQGSLRDMIEDTLDNPSCQSLWLDEQEERDRLLNLLMGE